MRMLWNIAARIECNGVCLVRRFDVSAGLVKPAAVGLCALSL